jgi:hypothetical protein
VSAVPCAQLDMIRPVTPPAPGCEDCLRIGSGWVHLRLCTACGHVGYCDSSQNRHASKHAPAVAQPIIVQSFEPGEDWLWCYGSASETRNRRARSRSEIVGACR